MKSIQVIYFGGSLKKVRCHTYKSEKNQVSTLKKIWVDASQKKSQVPPYKKLGRFYRVPFKSLLRVQIKWAFERGSTEVSLIHHIFTVIFLTSILIFSIVTGKAKINHLYYVDKRNKYECNQQPLSLVQTKQLKT